MKKILCIIAIFGFIGAALLTGCKPQETTATPSTPSTNAPSTNAPAQ